MNIRSFERELGVWERMKLTWALVAAESVPEEPLEAVSSKTSRTVVPAALQAAVPAALNVKTCPVVPVAVGKIVPPAVNTFAPLSVMAPLTVVVPLKTGLVKVLLESVSVPNKVAKVPLTGSVMDVAAVVVRMVAKFPDVLRFPPRVRVLDPLFTPVPP